jgi:hypothetical protein
MTSELELRRALGAIADLALDPEPLRSGLQAELHAHRQRRALLIAGSSVVGAAAAGVPAFLWLTRTPPAPFVGESALLHLRPTWLPDGMRACVRYVDHFAGLNEMQAFGSPEFVAALKATDVSFGSVGRNVGITVSDQAATDPSAAPTSPSNTEINGVPASLTTLEDGVSVSWPLPGGLTATVDAQRWDNADQAGEIVLRVARGLVADGRSSAAVAMRFGALPSQPAPPGDQLPLPREPFFMIYGTRTDWVQMLSFVGGATAVLAASEAKEAYWGPFDEPVTVRGLSGMASRQNTQLRVRLDDGRWLFASYLVGGFSPPAPEGLDKLVRIVDDMTIGPNPDLNWLGRGV